MKTNVLLAVALALAACAPEFDDASRLDGLRVLAIQAEPPEIAPAPTDGSAPLAPDRAALSSLVLRGDRLVDPVPTTTVVHLACVPTPGDPSPTPCVLLASLRDPTSVLADAARASCDAPPGQGLPVAFAGVERCDGAGCGPAVVGGTVLSAPEVALPAGFGLAFDALPPGAPERILGVQAIVIAFALDATPEEIAQPGDACPAAAVADRLSALWATREHVLSTKRVQIRGPEAPDAPNRNPTLDGVSADGVLLAADGSSVVPPGTVALAPALPAGAVFEPYTELDAAGAPIESAVEEWVYSWFSTSGDLDELHTRGPVEQRWEALGTGRALVAAVARDLRGGVAWVVREVTVGP